MTVRIGSDYGDHKPTPSFARVGQTPTERKTGITFKGEEVVIRESAEGRSRDNDRAWQEVQDPYTNYANLPAYQERTLTFVTSHMRRFQDRTESLRRKWLTIEHLLKGNTITRWHGIGSVHIPELYKALETLVPRIEEAILSYDPWFTVTGRDATDREVADRIKWFMEYQLDQAGLDELIQPYIRSMLVYGFGAIKIHWDRIWRQRARREGSREIDPDTGESVYRYRGKVVDVISYEGPSLELIDPFDFIIDYDTTRVADARFIGHSSWKTWEDIRELGKRGVYENWEKIHEETPKRGWGTSDYYQQSRSLVWTDDKYIQEPVGSAKKFKIVEIHGLFDLHGEGVARECVITVVNESTVVRVQEAPDDRGLRPYAVARCVKEPFQFFGIAPFDHAVRLNMELDDHRNLALEAHRLAVNPIAFVDQDSDIPPSLFNVEPGRVYRVRSPRDIQFMKIPMSVADAQAIAGELRRDIEETVGSPRIWEGSDAGSSTATEVERKIQEGNRRLKAYVRSISDGLAQMLKVMHSMNQQYLFEDQAFRVLGRDAARVSQFSEVSPEEFQMDADFEFQGLKGLKNMGLRATQLTQYLQMVAPLLPMLGGQINVAGLAKDLYEGLVDQRRGDEIISEMPSLDSLVTAEQEHMLWLQGQKTEVHPMDSDEEHLRMHRAFVANDELFSKIPDAIKAHALLHVDRHENQRKQKALRKQAESQQSPAFAGAQPQRNGEGGRPSEQPGAGMAVPPGGGAAVQPAAGGQIGGETPGPEARPTDVQTPGRSGQLYQTQNQAGG